MAMTLDELKGRINIPPTIDDTKLQIRLDDAIDFVEKYLHRSFVEDMPNCLKAIVAKHVQSEMYFRNDGVKTESIDGLSQTFESKDERDKALKVELRATGLRKLVW